MCPVQLAPLLALLLACGDKPAADTARDHGPEALARAILLMQRVAHDLAPEAPEAGA